MSPLKLRGEDIGNPIKRGSAEEQANGYKVIAGGADIWGLSDQGHFAYASYSGDFDLKLRLESLGMADLYTKAGIMARESLDADSAHVFLMVFPDNSPRNKNNGGYEFQFRETKGGDSLAIYPPDFTSEPPAFPVNFPQTWLRLLRRENLFQAFYSKDGSDWTLYAEKTLKLTPSVLLGVAVTSHNEQATVQATIQDITLH